MDETYALVIACIKSYDWNKLYNNWHGLAWIDLDWHGLWYIDISWHKSSCQFQLTYIDIDWHDWHECMNHSDWHNDGIILTRIDKKLTRIDMKHILLTRIDKQLTSIDNKRKTAPFWHGTHFLSAH